MHTIAPRGVYASGKGSSAVGLTAYVTRDPESKQLVLERYEIQLLTLLEIANLYFLVVRLSWVLAVSAVSTNLTKCRMPRVVSHTKSW